MPTNITSAAGTTPTATWPKAATPRSRRKFSAGATKTAPDKIVCLGLITTKRPREETEDEVIARIHEAARYLPLERLSLSTQCGFASVAKGNNIPFELGLASLATDSTLEE